MSTTAQLREAQAENEFLRNRCLELSTAIDSLAAEQVRLQERIAELEAADRAEDVVSGDDPTS